MSKEAVQEKEVVEKPDHELTAEEYDKKYPPLTIRIVGSTQSAYIKQGTENTSNPEYMAWPGLYRIMPTSSIKEGRGLKQIRHVYGCDSIDPKFQDANGYTPNLDTDNIWVVNGSLTIVRKGSDIGAYDYIKKYQGNVSNPDRPDNAEDEFEEVIESEVAREKVVEFAPLAEAISLLDTFRIVEKVRGGQQKVEYDEEKVLELAKLLGIDTSVSTHEIFADLQSVAMRDPKRIVNSISNPRKRVVLDIKKAEDLGVLLFEDNRVVFAEDKSVLIGFKQKYAPNVQIQKLAEMLTSSNGKSRLEQLRIKIEAAEELELSGSKS